MFRPPELTGELRRGRKSERRSNLKWNHLMQLFPPLKFPNLTHLTFNEILQPLMHDDVDHAVDWLLLTSNQALPLEMHHHHQSGS